MFKNLANLATLMKQAQQVGGKFQNIAEQLKNERVTGSAGGGMVEVEANGLGEVLRVKFDRQLLERADQDLLESLTPAAVNQALEKAKQRHAELVQSAVGDINVPGLDKALGQLTGTTGS